MTVRDRIVTAANVVSMVDRLTLKAQLRTFFQSLERIPEVNAVLTQLADNAKKIDLEGLIRGLDGIKKPYNVGWVQLLSDSVPTRNDRAAFQQEALGFIMNADGDPFNALLTVCGQIGRGPAETLDYLRREVFAPLAAFYLDEVAQPSDTFRLLGLYKRSVEWFDRADLCAKLNKESQCEDHLRRFLLQHGVANPFSQTVAALGARQDITFYEDEHPIAIEIKYQEEQSKVAAEVAKGVRQAFLYAEALSSSTCYFVMFNKTKKLLLFEGSSPGRPFFAKGGTGIYCVSVNLDLDAPSKVKTADAPLILREAEVFADWSTS